MARWLVAIGIVLGCDPPEVMDLPPRRLAADASLPVVELETLPRSSVPVGMAIVLERGEQVFEQIANIAGDDEYVYRIRGYDELDSHTSWGPRYAIERVDRESGRKRWVGEPLHGFGSIVLFRGDLYGGNYAHPGVFHGVVRVPSSGGEMVRVWPDDQIRRLTAYADGVLVTGSRTLAWIDAERRVTKLYDLRDEDKVVDERVDSAVADDRYVYAAVTGSIQRFSLVTGRQECLLTTRRHPTRIAKHEHTVYFGIDDSDELWSVPEAGGAPSLVYSSGVRSHSGKLAALWSGERGLYWIRNDRYDGKDATLNLLAWP